MRLRNKHTCKITEIEEVNLVVMNDERDCYESFAEYHSLAELNEDWEDCTPKEPLIKDEKIRKAVRAWAEVNDITEINVASSGYELWGGIDDWCIHFGGNPFKNIKPLKYTIDELCGDEEE